MPASLSHDPQTSLSAPAARRIALAAQGFADPRPRGRVDVRHVRRVIERVGLLQLDSVNVLCRSHYVPLFSRLGPYPQALLDRLAAHRTEPSANNRPAKRSGPAATAGAAAPVSPATTAGRPAPERELFEYWAHEASLLPVATHPLLRWRMANADREAWSGIVHRARERPELLDAVLELARERGPIRAADTGVAPRLTSTQREMWDWHEGKVALEYLFYAGHVSAYERVRFERRYDLAERVLPPRVMAAPTPSEPDAQRELMRIAARALGVAAEPDLGDYFRLPRAASKARTVELVESGELVPVAVEGWGVPAYLWHEARRPRSVSACALLSPFDSLVWFRARAERLFGFRYRLEIYTPAAKRVYGYYVLPFLLGDALQARTDLKSDRATGTLLVRSAFAEPATDRPHLVGELAQELRLAARWLGLEDVRVERDARGDLATDLARALA